MKTVTDADVPLFMQVKNSIYAQILDGVYDLGQRLPTESKLVEQFAVSRVTIRKALDELKAENVVSSVQGQGTVVTLGQNVSKNCLDTLALVANARDNFFSTFLDAIDKQADKEEALVVYKSDRHPYADQCAQTFKALYERDIRNCVLWPNRGFEDKDVLHRLRLLGMNLVFFDHVFESADIDCVVLDNRHAIQTLFRYLQQQDHRHIDYLGWNNVPLSSTAERTETFCELDQSADNVYEFARDTYLDVQLEKYVLESQRSGELSQAIICGNGDLALSLARTLDRYPEYNPQLVCVDEFPREQIPDIVCYAQPMEKLARKAFACLQRQNNPDVQWSAKTYRIKGELLV